MSKVKITSDNLSGKGTQIELDGVKLHHVTKAELAFRVGEPVKLNVEVLAHETHEQFEADTHLTIAYRLDHLSERKLRSLLEGHFEKQLGHGNLFSPDEVFELITKSVGKLKP